MTWLGKVGTVLFVVYFVCLVICLMAARFVAVAHCLAVVGMCIGFDLYSAVAALIYLCRFNRVEM